MTTLYVDTSALGAAYFPDEPDHHALNDLVFGSAHDVVTSAITRVELSSAVRSASEAGRVPDPDRVWDTIDADFGESGPVGLISLRADPVLTVAVSIVRRHRVRTLDAIHLAVALEDGTRVAAPQTLVFTTLDHHQATAARALGLNVHPLAD